MILIILKCHKQSDLDGENNLFGNTNCYKAEDKLLTNLYTLEMRF